MSNSGKAPGSSARTSADGRRLGPPTSASCGRLGPIDGILAADFTLTLGDEFQALLLYPSDTMDVLAETEHELKGIPLRYGVGLGCLSTDLKSKTIGMDGPCFHRAREAITKGRRLGRWAIVSGFGDDDNLLNAVLGLIGAIRSQWTDIQSETVYLARSLDTHKDVARELGRHTSTISKALKSASFEAVDAGERAAELILSRHGRTTPPHAEHGRA